LVPLKNAASARNARSKKITLRAHGGSSKALLHAPLDLRSAVGKAYRNELQALLAHVGGEQHVSTPQRALCDQAARLALLEAMAWAEVLRDGVHAPAAQVFLRASSERRAVLVLLGLERKTKPAPTLEQYLGGRRD
jgi:hypothetical protein